jgi:hypothetical protein
MHRPDTYLSNALVKLTAQPISNELAFLALTSKVELPVRDRLSFAIAQMLEAEGSLVSREWKERVDIAVLSSSREPEALIELKCMYSFDIFSSAGERRFQSAVEGDRLKLKRITTKYSMKQASMYVLVLVTHPLSAPNAEYSGIIKYLKQIRNANQWTSKEVNAKLASSFGNFLVSTGCIPCGSWLGTQVEVHYALHRVYADA